MELTIIGIMLLKVGILVSREHSSVGTEVQERVEQMSDLSSREISRLVVAVIDTPYKQVLAKPSRIHQVEMYFTS